MWSQLTKQEQIARLALGRAITRCSHVVCQTDCQATMVQLLREIEPRAVLSLVGADGVRIHGTFWGGRPAATDTDLIIRAT